jgi:type II secretory pathway component PulJ
MIIILTVTTFILALFLTAAILHIHKIQKELETILKMEQEQQNLLNIIVQYDKDLGSAVKDIQDYLFKQPDIMYPFGRIMGEA